MRISYLLQGFGSTGGGMVLYKFMDKLSERGHEVFAVTPNERVRWEPNFSHEIIERFNRRERNGLVGALYGFGRKVVKKSDKLEEIARIVLKKAPIKPIKRLPWLTQRLIQNWVQSDITISTFCTTCYTNYALMDKTIPLYHMQHYEELFFNDELSQKIARLTYYLPSKSIANSSWLQSQIKEKIGRDSYLLNPGIDTDIFYPRVEIDKKYEDLSKISIVSYYSPKKFKAWNDAVEAMKIVFEKLGNDRLEWNVFGGMPPSLPGIPVNFKGKIFKDSLTQLYSNAHIVFMNSWYESFPLPPLEAMACGTAVVTTRIGTEDYASQRENALVIPPRKPQLLAEDIIGLTEQPSLACQLAKNGVDTAHRFSWDRAANCLEEIIQDVKVNHRRNPFVDIPDLVSGNF